MKYKTVMSPLVDILCARYERRVPRREIEVITVSLETSFAHADTVTNRLRILHAELAEHGRYVA